MVPFRADSRGPNPTANLVSDRGKENMCINTRSILVFFCVLKRILSQILGLIGGTITNDKRLIEKNYVW